MSEEVVVYYRKDPSWMATSFLYPPTPVSPDCLVEVHRGSYAEAGTRSRHDFLKFGDTSILEEVWVSMQGIEAGDLCDRLQVRSMMVGDVVAIGETAYLCESVGWKEIDVPWLHEGPKSSCEGIAPPNVFPVLGLNHAQDSKEDATSS